MPLPPGARPPASDEIVTHRPAQPLGLQPYHSPRSADHVAERCSPGPRLPGHWSAARVPGTPIGCGGRSRERGSGWHPERGELARKLKGAAGRRAARVRGGGPRGGGKQAALARRRMRLRAGGADLSPGPRSYGRPRCACCPRTDAAAGGPLCTAGFVNSTRYVLPKPRSARAGPRKPRRGARGEDPVWCRPSVRCPSSRQWCSEGGSL